MEKYLGKKGRARRTPDIPLLIFLGLMLMVVFGALSPEEYLTDAAGFIAFVIVVGMFALPFWLTVSHRLLWKDARAAARCLAVWNGPSMPLSALGEQAKLKRPQKRVTQLIDRGYLINAQLDPAHGAVLLGGWAPPARSAQPWPASGPAAATIDLRCPHCGGATPAVPGRPTRCQWCDSALENPAK